jgi:hypothetical protein
MPKPRSSLTYAQWPEIDRRLWQQAARDDDPLIDIGLVARWAPRTRETVSKGYGNWLFWLKSQGLLDAAEFPDTRCSPTRLLAYVQSMQGLSPAPGPPSAPLEATPECLREADLLQVNKN